MQIASEVCGSWAPAVILKGGKGRRRARSSRAPSCSAVATTLWNERYVDAALLIRVDLEGTSGTTSVVGAGGGVSVHVLVDTRS